MSEQVIRHRGADFDAHGDPIAGASTPLRARAVERRFGEEQRKLGRNSDIREYRVYFWPAVDLTDLDELTVRGDRCHIQVAQWNSPRTKRRATEVIARIGVG